jgi:hypothetical protein
MKKSVQEMILDAIFVPLGASDPLHRDKPVTVRFARNPMGV